MSELNYLLPKLSLVGMSMMYNIDVHTPDVCSQIKKQPGPKTTASWVGHIFRFMGVFPFPVDPLTEGTWHISGGHPNIG